MILRNCNIDDAPIIHKELGCNAEMLRYTGWNPYSTLESTIGFLSGAINSEDNYSWVVEQDGEVVGTIGAYDFWPEDGSIEIGCSIFQKHWGKGFASQAVADACEILFKEKRIGSIKAWAAKDNVASVKALEKNGFVRKEVKEAAINVNGESYDQEIYERKA